MIDGRWAGVCLGGLVAAAGCLQPGCAGSGSRPCPKVAAPRPHVSVTTAPPASAVTPSTASAPVPANIEPSIWKTTIVSDGTRFKIEGSKFAIGDPVHETITRLALLDAGLVSADGAADADVDFIRGVFWNDDPCASLFEGRSGLAPSWGVQWYLDFEAAEGNQEKSAAAFQHLTCPLLGRSHFGDMQFLHSMASTDGVSAEQTRAEVLQWAELTYRVALGELDPDHTLGSAIAHPNGPIHEVGKTQTPRALFVAAFRQEIAPRALGSLLHLIQDSYAAGHTERVENGLRRGKLRSFYSYAHQNHDKHGSDDAWHGGSGGRDSVSRIRGGTDALEASTQAVRLFKARAPWPEMREFLERGPFAFADNPGRSGPGKDYANCK